MMPPEQVHLIYQWMEKAEEDYRNAKFTLTLEEDCPFSTVCFHSQQCVEKYLKALLVCHSISVPKSHDLLELYNRVPVEQKPGLSEEALAVLNRYAVEARYPGNWDVISRDEASSAFKSAQAISDLLHRVISAIIDRNADS
jgi:HEPN domain-containing protein